MSVVLYVDRMVAPQGMWVPGGPSRSLAALLELGGMLAAVGLDLAMIFWF